MGQTSQSICLYSNTKKSEIKMISSKIKTDEDFILEIENILPTIRHKERTSKELRGISLIKNIRIGCNKNLIKQIEEMPDCV